MIAAVPSHLHMLARTTGVARRRQRTYLYASWPWSVHRPRHTPTKSIPRLCRASARIVPMRLPRVAFGRCHFDAPGNVLCKGIVVADKTTGLTAKRDYSQNPLPLASVPTGFQAGAGAKVFAGVAAVSEDYYAVCYPSGATGSSSSVNFAKVGCSMINMQCGDPAAPATTCTNNAESFPVVVTTVSPPELRYFTPRVSMISLRPHKLS